jgi:hypothetical protein
MLKHLRSINDHELFQQLCSGIEARFEVAAKVGTVPDLSILAQRRWENSSIDDKSRATFLAGLGGAIYSADKESAQKLFDAALEIADAIPRSELRAKAFSQLVEPLRQAGQWGAIVKLLPELAADSSQDWTETIVYALAHAGRISEALRVGKESEYALARIAIAQIETGDNEGAETTLQRARRKALESNARTASALNTSPDKVGFGLFAGPLVDVVAAHGLAGNFDKALAIARELEQSTDARSASRAYASISMAYAARKDWSSAQSFLTRVQYAEPRTEAALAIARNAVEAGDVAISRNAFYEAFQAAIADSDVTLLQLVATEQTKAGFWQDAAYYARFEPKADVRAIVLTLIAIGRAEQEDSPMAARAVRLLLEFDGI